MTVQTWTLHLCFRGPRCELQTDRSLNDADDGMLRSTLEELVRQRLGRAPANLADWSLLVRDPHTFAVRAKVEIDRAGRTQVTR